VSVTEQELGAVVVAGQVAIALLTGGLMVVTGPQQDRRTTAHQQTNHVHVVAACREVQRRPGRHHSHSTEGSTGEGQSRGRCLRRRTKSTLLQHAAKCSGDLADTTATQQTAVE